jgi:tetratricopeptide (TPR) repeat protein
MFLRMLAVCAALFLGAASAEAGRVALVIGQNAYPGHPGDNPETVGLPHLDNPVPDAKSVVELFAGAGFEVLSCDGKQPGCFDLNREGILKALAQLKERAASADLALVYFAGHGAATDEGNIVTPIDAKVDCETGAIAQGVLVEHLLQAVEPAKHKFLILDACRDNPIGAVCPGLQGKKLSFTRIEAGALQGLLLVTSTQFGQQAKDGPPGTHSPFAKALLASLKASPNVYFEQVMNEVASATNKDALEHYGFLQIPGKVVGGAAPEDCLAGKDCIGDARMAALAAENGQLASDAAGVRSLLADDERARGKPYTAEERKTRVAALQATLASIGKSSDPLRQEARRLIGEGNVAGGEAKLDEALDADEKAAAEQERLAQERRKAAARSARDLAVLASGKDVLKALGYYRRATKLDASDAEGWNAYAAAARDAGRIDEAKTAFGQGARVAEAGNNPGSRYWALIGLGEVSQAQGDLPSARKSFGQAQAIAEFSSLSDPGNVDWQRNLSVAYGNIAGMQDAQGDLSGALENFKRALEIQERLAQTQPDHSMRQHDLWTAHNKIGEVLKDQGNLTASLREHNTALEYAKKLAILAPANPISQQALAVSYTLLGDVFLAQGNLPEAFKSYNGCFEIRDRLAKTDPSNATWQRELSSSNESLGDVYLAQGNLAAALEQYQASLGRMIQISGTDPNNADLLSSTSVTLNKTGGVLEAQGNLPLALQAYNAGLVIADRLAGADPGNIQWQGKLASNLGRLGRLYVRMGSKEEARAMFERGRTIVAPFAEKSGHQLWIGYLKGFDGDLAALEASPFQEARAQAQAAFNAGQPSKAAAAQAKLAGAVEKAEREKAGKPGPQTASALGALSWYRLFAHDFKGALAASERAGGLASDPVYATNRAHALMFLGRAREAKWLYQMYKGQPVEKGGKLWEEAIRDDFKEFWMRGLRHAQMAEIEALLAAPAQGAR